MAKQQAGTYTKQEQEAIKAEIDTDVQKLLQGHMRKHPGMVVGSTLAFTFPSAPQIIEHSGNTHKLSTTSVKPPPQATE